MDAVLHQNIYQLEPWEVVEEVPSFSPQADTQSGGRSQQTRAVFDGEVGDEVVFFLYVYFSIFLFLFFF